MINRTSWGRYFQYQHRAIIRPNWVDQIRLPSESKLLCYGLGRSYGDSCLNEKQILIETTGLNRFISFDAQTGILRCESGVSFADIISHFLPRGYFLPVTPGTKFITVGGAIANDIHGKNHHRAGTFGRFVRRFGLLRSNGETIECSPQSNGELFRATIGGLGLTGFIIWAEFQLIKVDGPLIDQEVIRFGSLDEFFTLEDESQASHEYTVAWVDCVASGSNLGRGIFIRGNHSSAKNKLNPPLNLEPKFRAPITAPNWALNHFSVSVFNQLYFHRSPRLPKAHQISFDPFFYPLDSVAEWNRIYGKRGFFQYQFVIGPDQRDAIREILRLIAKSGQASFLAVLKRFGEIPSPGMISFPMRGITLALDFPNRGEETLSLFRNLDGVVRASNGRFYPAKDSTMSSADFKNSFPSLSEFSKWIDPDFSSSFWRRVMGD
jgi:FAD/FMN-containing dehydrogenase